MIQEIKEYDSDTCLEIGIRIQDIRESRHMKAIELASYLGIGKNQMSRIESGKANCTIPQLYCIAQILDCSADFLLFGEEHMNYSPEMVELVNNLKMVTGRIEGEIKNKYIHEYVKNKEYMIVGTERRHGFSQNDVDRQWHQIVDKIKKKQVDGVIVANMSVITDNLIDAFVKIAQVQAAGGIIVTVDDGRLAMQLRGF